MAALRAPFIVTGGAGFIFHSIHTLGLTRLARVHYGGLGAILMFHSVVPDRRPYLEHVLHSSAAFLDALLAHYRAQGIDIVTLDEVRRRVVAADHRSFICFTFDDGYRDTFLHALPIFETYRAPFAVYVTTAMIERRCNYYWEGCLRELLKKLDRIDIAELDVHATASTYEEKRRLFSLITGRVRENQAAALPTVERLLAKHGISAAQLLEQEAMSRDELCALARSPLVEIGAHTDSHRPLAELSEAEAEAEIRANRSYLEGILQREVKHFAYPFGDQRACTPRDFALVARLGFATATTTRNGPIFARHAEYLTALPRIAATGNLERISYMECQRAGLVRMVMSRFGDPVAVN